MPQGGHSKSPNSSSVTGAFALPSACSGSAPSAAWSAVLGVLAEGDATEAGGADGVSAVERWKYRNIKTPAPSTATMMTKGRARFIFSQRIDQIYRALKRT